MRLRVDVDERGRVSLSASDGSRAIASLIAIEAMVDAGDLYTPSLRGQPSIAELSAPRAGLRGPLRATLTIPWNIESSSDVRLQRPESATGTLTLSLDAGARHLGVELSGVNGMRNHWLRLRITTNVRGAAVFADAAFGAVQREPIVAPATSAEIPPLTAPLARYVTLASAARGATIYSDGLGEYEVLPDGTVAVTLLRAVGELSRNDLPERPGHAGWPASTPEAQEQGEFGGRFGFLLHSARDDATIAHIERTADDVLHPLVGRTVRSATPLPVATHGATLEGEGLAFSAIKPSARGEWLVLRCVNLLERAIEGAWSLGVAAREAASVAARRDTG